MRSASLLHSFKYAFEGIWYVLRSQRNAKIHLGVTLAVILLGLFLRLSALHWAVLLVTVGMVFAAEMFNTVIESLIDLVSPNYHPLAKIAKDAAAGAVFILAMMSVLVGLLVLGPPLWVIIWTYLK
ncbi:MAG TPA: diacylglycerol kinase family protein [Chloroflexi bacterium]|nr:diacylglycerol kinase family protein [Chloroflexota bacterium]